MSDVQLTEYGAISSQLLCSKLSDLCIDKVGVQTGPFGTQLHKEDYVEVGTPIITVEHLGDNRIVHQGTPFVSDEDKDRLSKYHLEEGDIVFSRVGSVDRRALVRKEENGWLFSGRCLRVRVDRSKIDPVYLSYFFGLESFKNYIRSIAVGATMPSINTKMLSDVPIYYPEDLIEQKRIAEIFYANDEKIELNRQTNQTLEQIAQAIFKSWFVDVEPVKAKVIIKGKGGNELAQSLAAQAIICGAMTLEQLQELENDYRGFVDKIHSLITEKFPNELGGLDYWTPKTLQKAADLFPNAMVESELGETPMGWDAKPLGNYLEIKRGGSPRPIKEYIVEEGFPWTKIADATKEPSPFLFKTKECIKEEGLKKTVLLKKGTLILSNSATPGLPKFLELDACIHDGWLYFPKKELFSDIYLFQLFLVLKETLIAQGNGSVFTNLKTDILRNQLVVAPTKEMINVFDCTVFLLFEKVKENCKEINTIVELRDSILPKLLSGDLSVDKVA